MIERRRREAAERERFQLIHLTRVRHLPDLATLPAPPKPLHSVHDLLAGNPLDVIYRADRLGTRAGARYRAGIVFGHAYWRVWGRPFSQAARIEYEVRGAGTGPSDMDELVLRRYLDQLGRAGRGPFQITTGICVKHEWPDFARQLACGQEIDSVGLDQVADLIRGLDAILMAIKRHDRLWQELEA